MLKEEAVWIRRELKRIDPASLYPMCNLGSSTFAFRTIEQPYIDSHLFATARSEGWKVVHVDMKAAPGVDVVGDFTDGSLASELLAFGFKSVMCCNLLEHVRDRRKLADLAVSIVQPGGYIIVSVPNQFPYHEDPIDTMYRPDLEELASLFPDTEVVEGKIVRASRLVHDFGGSWNRAFWLIVRLFAPLYRPRRWLAAVHQAQEMLRGYRVACVILRRRL